MSENDNDNNQTNKPQNVIRFPVEKVRHKNRLKRLAGKMGDNKKSTLFLSLLSVLVVSVYLMKNTQQVNNRTVANAPDTRDPVKEAELNESLQDSRRRNPASYGRKPTAEEKLREQELNRGYQFKYNGNDGLVIEATYLRAEDDREMFEPVYLKADDISDFLLRHRQAISPGYDDVTAETDSYLLIRNETPVGRVKFQFDERGRLLSMKVQVF